MPTHPRSDPPPDPMRHADAGSRLLGVIIVWMGLGSMAIAGIVGTATLAATYGAGRAAWLVFSVAALTGQVVPDGASDRVALIGLATWMASAYITLAVGSIVLWNTRRKRQRTKNRGERPDV